MKFLFKVIFLPIIVILAIPVTILALMYKSVDIPVTEFATTGPTDLTEMVTTELDAFLTNTDSDSTISIGLEQAEANTMVKNMIFLEMNPNYLDGSGGDDDAYVEKTEYYGLQGAWVRFNDDIVEIEAGAHVFVAGITYKTRLLLSFKLDVSTDEVVLTLDKLTIGNLGLAWAFPVADWLVTTIAQQDISEMINGYLGGLATFDVGSKSMTMDIQSLVDEQITDPQQSALVNSLMAFLDANDMLDVGFTEGEFSASLALGKAYDDTTPFVVEDPIEDADELQVILEAKASSLLVSVLSTSTNPYISFGELTLNRMLEFMMRDSFQGTDPEPKYLFSTLLFEHYEMKAWIPYLSMVDDQLTVNIPLSLYDLNDLTHEFKTIIKIDATPAINGSDLEISLNELTAGQVTIGQEHIANILTLLGDSSLISDGKIVISDFDQELSQAGMSLEDVEVVAGRLRLYVGLSDANLLADVQDAVTTALDGVNYSDYGTNGEALGDDIDALQTLIDSGTASQEDIDAAMEDVMDSLDNLTDEEQELLFGDLTTQLEGTDLTLDDILGLLP